MIVEGLVTTRDARGMLHVAAQGPIIEDADRLVFRPFRGSSTLENLLNTSEGVFHLIDDPLLLARVVVGGQPGFRTRPADVVQGCILLDACGYLEFRLIERNIESERASLTARVVAEGQLREFRGWNRASHAIIEAAIVATRIGILPDDSIRAEFERAHAIVEKTGGAREHEAWRLLEEFRVARLANRDVAP
jgi:hypothetical protein